MKPPLPSEPPQRRALQTIPPQCFPAGECIRSGQIRLLTFLEPECRDGAIVSEAAMSGSRVLLLPFIETLGALQAVFTSFSIAPAVEIDLAAIFDLDHATNDRLLAENDLLPGIDTHELIFGISYYRIMNAAFCHAQPLGSRFNGPDRGAWYAAFEIETAQAEVAFHKALELAEVGWKEESVTYDDYLADFSGEFHIRTGYRRTDVRGSDFAGETRHKPPVEVGSV